MTTSAVEHAIKSGQAEARPLNQMQKMYYQQTLRRMQKSRDNIIDGADNHTSFKVPLEKRG